MTNSRTIYMSDRDGNTPPSDNTLQLAIQQSSGPRRDKQSATFLDPIL